MYRRYEEQAKNAAMASKETPLSRADESNDITFYINGDKHVVSDKLPASTTLNDYIRDVAGLKGTKLMCKEAGCGCCAVAVTHAFAGEKTETMSINSCLCPLYSCDGWQVSTVEGLGSSKQGFHPIQERIANYNGTQCGYCTPGFVMSLYGLLHQDPKATQQEIEDSFDGHLCRCTGYRSILDAMKSFGSDSTAPGTGCIDIEDLNLKLCPKTGEACKGRNGNKCDHGQPPTSLSIDLKGSKWYRPLNLADLGIVLQKHKDNVTFMVFGNTAAGIFKHEGPYEVYIDLRAVKELHKIEESAKAVVFGAGTTLTKVKDYLKTLQNKRGYQYSSRVVRHLKVVASVLVRNAGSIAGNLMIKHKHPDFPSDVFTILTALGCTVDVFDSRSSKVTRHSMVDFLKKVNMVGKVLTAVEFPAWSENDHYRSFKITPRWQNAHAYVNAAFKINVNQRKIVGQPNFVFGGVNSQMVHATKAEEFIKNKTLNNDVIAETLKILYAEVHPSSEPVLATPKYRRELAVNLLYKTLLEVYKPEQNALHSGAASLQRPLSSGLQTFQEKKDKLPLRKPTPKKTAPLQASGEAIYINDIPGFQRELHAHFVISDVAVANIKQVDASNALKIPGVVKFVGAADIPKGGVNNFIPDHPMFVWAEELFASKEIEYAGQAIGLILADSEALAEEGARAVSLTYTDVKEPVVELEDAIEKNTAIQGATQERVIGDPEGAMRNAAHVLEGTVREGTQYHCAIENQIAVAVPSEDGVDVYSATQWGDMVQRSVMKVLGKPMNYVNITTPRLGGGFGGKIVHSAAIASAACVAAEATGRPVRLNVDMATNMKYASKRFPILAKYKAACDAAGKMLAVVVDIYVDSGIRATPMIFDLIGMLDEGYHVPNWKIRMIMMKTNKPVSAATRGPGSVPACLIIETIMEEMAKIAGQHPILFKEMNLVENGQKDVDGVELTLCTMKEVWRRLKQLAEVDARIQEVAAFNKNNKWVKRGLTMSAVKYGMLYMPGSGLPTSVSVFARDGSVTVITSGIEMGQGLYTKVAQAVAHGLGIPIDYVKVRPNQNNVTPNGFYTGASTTSERCVASALQASAIIKERLAPIREKMPGASWPELVEAAYCIDLQASSTHFHDGEPVPYFTYMAGVTETELDSLTGEYQVRRVDIMADFGESINPTIDIGQVEGAFTFGLGAYLLEDVKYEHSSGSVINDGTFEYKPPTTKDIPIDWRIHFMPDSPNPVGVVSSKAVGEPPVGLAVGAMLGLRSAAECVREDLGLCKHALYSEAPFTVEKAQQLTGVTIDKLKVAY